MFRHALLISITLVFVVAVGVLARGGFGMTLPWSATEARFESFGDVRESVPVVVFDPYADWVRPEGPPTVAVQAGHWLVDEVPDELENLKWNGARAAGIEEWEVALAIAEEVARMLEEEGVTVDLLPATVPPDHWSDVFVSIHADGSLNTAKSGFKVAASSFDRTRKAERLAVLLTASYAEGVDLPRDPNVTDNMREYYAFNSWRYEHSIHPMTVAAIVETGFLTNARDRALIVRRPEVPARAIADGVLAHLREQGLLE